MGLSIAAQVIIAIVPLAAIIFVSILGFFYMLWEYRKNRIIIENGGTPKEYNINEKILLIGIVSLFVGMGLLFFFAIYSGFTSSLLGGIIPFFTGLGIITYFLVRKRLT
jgi:hypothetical protein